MIKLTDLIVEKRGDAYEYGCAMLYLDFPELKSIQKIIYKEDIYEEDGDRTYGLEDEPHVTLLFGLHEGVSKEDIKNITDDYTFSDCKVYRASIFKNEKYDVLKFEVEGDNLREVNKRLKEHPHTSTFPGYNPHLTIGYIKPGQGKKYVSMLDGKRYTSSPKYVVYSHDNIKEKIKIKTE